MKRILIVGAGGQIGSELTVYLRKIYGNHNVVATDMRECKSLGEDGPFEVLNALDATAMASVVARYHVDTIFNLVALLSAVGERNPQMAWNVNMGALNNSLEVARQHHCALFTPSSIGAFGPTSPKDKTPQDTIMQPTTIYGVCKVTGELLGNYYHHKFGVDTRSVRFPGIISNVTLPGGGTTDYAVEIYYEAIRSGRFTCPVPGDVYMDMIYMPDALRACVELMEADPSKLVHRNSFNLASMSFTPEIIYAEIRKRLPDFTMTYDIDPVKREIAESWPNSLDDTCAREEWGWKPEWDLSRMTDDMLAHIRAKLAKSPRDVERELKPTVERLAASSSSWNGEPLPACRAERPFVTLLRIVVPPHARLARHRHPVLNAGVLLRGELTVVAEDGTERTFRAGEGIIEMVGTLHYGENRGDEPAELVMCYVGAEDAPLSVAE